MSRRRARVDLSHFRILEFRCGSHPTKRGPRVTISHDDRAVAPYGDPPGWSWKRAEDGTKWLAERCAVCDRPVLWSEAQLRENLIGAPGGNTVIRY